MFLTEAKAPHLHSYPSHEDIQVPPPKQNNIHLKAMKYNSVQPVNESVPRDWYFCDLRYARLSSDSALRRSHVSESPGLFSRAPACCDSVSSGGSFMKMLADPLLGVTVTGGVDSRSLRCRTINAVMVRMMFTSNTRMENID